MADTVDGAAAPASTPPAEPGAPTAGAGSAGAEPAARETRHGKATRGHKAAAEAPAVDPAAADPAAADPAAASPATATTAGAGIPAAEAPAATPPAETVSRSADIVAGPGGVMTDEVGVVTGDLTLRTDVSAGEATLHVQYKDADEWYVVTGARTPITDPADIDAVHTIAVALLHRPEG